MTIRVLQNRTTVRPVGVVKSPKISAEAELYSSIAKLGTKYMGIAYQRGVQEAKQAGGEDEGYIQARLRRTIATRERTAFGLRQIASSVKVRDDGSDQPVHQS